MRSQYNPMIVVAVDSKRNTKGQNSLNRMAFREALDRFKVDYQSCVGVYDGFEERSYMLPYNEAALILAESALKYYNQECFLVMDNEGRGTLVYKDGLPKVIGFLETSDEKPKGDYTEVLSTGQYITFK